MTAIPVERAKDGYRLGKDEGEAYWLLGMLEIVKVSGADTGGEFGLLEVTVRAGEGSPWHVHPEEDEWFYVLEGEFTVYVGEKRLSLTPGSFAFGPRGVPHTFIGETDGSKALVGFQPFLFESFLHEVGRAGDRAGAASAAFGSPRHGATAPDRRAPRNGDPGASRAAARPLKTHQIPTVSTPD